MIAGTTKHGARNASSPRERICHGHGVTTTLTAARIRNRSSPLPEKGTVFISVADRDKAVMIPIARQFAEMGYHLIATRGTAKALRDQQIPIQEIPKIQEGRPNLIDMMKNGKIAMILNTPSGRGRRTDEGRIRSAAVAHRVTCITTLAAAQAAVEACRAMREKELTVTALQERFPAAR